MSAVFTIGKSLETGLPVHIRNAKNGLGCNCLCYQCNAKLEAVQGSRDWYFRHHNKSNCKGSPETALHQYAKLILYESSFINTNKKTIEYTEPCRETVIEKFRSDVSAKYNEQDIHFEIVVNNDLEPSKVKYYRSNKINCIKIDLTDPKLLYALPEKIKSAIVEKIENKEFIQWNENDDIKDHNADNWLMALIVFLGASFSGYVWTKKRYKKRIRRL